MSGAGRVLGLDLGTKRIGVARSDPSGVLATPHSVLPRAARRAEDHRAIATLLEDEGATRVVVGLPLSLDGGTGPAARAVFEEVEALRAALPVPVEVHDERLTTVSADRSLRTMGVKGAARRRVVDSVAATVLLQSWLDSATHARATRG